MNIEMTNKEGVTLLTAGKYCKDNIQVIPTFSVGTGGTPIEVASAEEMAEILANATPEDYGKIYLYTGTTTADYTQGIYYVLEQGEPAPEPELTPTEGLAYTNKGTFATCTGIGTATDRDIVIASEYEGLPVTEIKSDAFSYKYNITSVFIPNSVTKINGNAFYQCSGLNSIEIPDSVTSIAGYVFYECSGLNSIEIPDSVTSIGNNLFYACKALVNVKISNSVTSIGGLSFNMCYALPNIEIPDSVTSISNGAFKTCYSLKLADFRKCTQIPTLGTSVFDSTHSTLKIVVPDALYDEWIVATNWSNYASKIVKASDYTEA